MASVTYWNRVEPRPRATSIARPLAAQVRDPLWFLTRQWQFGEFQGEDAASPAYVQLDARFAPVTGWRAAGGGSPQTFANDAPLEALVETEPFSPDTATAVELGQRFETLLAGAGLGSLAGDFRAAFAIARPTNDDLNAMPDQDLARFLRVVAGKVVDGAALYAATAALPALPDPPAIPPAQQDPVRDVLTAFRDWVRAVYGDIGTGDAPAWVPERLEYGVEVTAITPGGEVARFDAYPGPDGEFDWYAFDQRPTIDDEAPPEDAITALTRSVLPTRVRFRGMPNARWWHFENGSMSFGDIQPDRRELGKLALMDFMLVHGNDWLLVPFAQAAGTLCRVDALLVHDVFGGVTAVERADSRLRTGDITRRWSLFSTSVAGRPGDLADFFILPPSATTSTLSGAALEDVRFLRDEMANMVWAIEHATENGLGQPWPAQERVQAAAGRDLPGPPAPSAPLAYRIQTSVPENWIPFVPVLIDPARRDIALERGAMLRDDGTLAPIRPTGRVLRPTGLADPAIYRVREEEISRSGLRVTRLARRSRWIDGSTHLWIARRKRAGAGEGSSGLRFDIAVKQAEE